MILFVDIEHETARSAPWADRVYAARTWITYRLEDLSGMSCMLVRWDRLTIDLVNDLDVRAIFLSGNSAPPSDYESSQIESFDEVLRSCGLPIFGFCGGHQFIARAFGSSFVALGPAEQDDPAAADDVDGSMREVGYHPIEVLVRHSLLAGISDSPVFRHAHGLHVPDPPRGFTAIASTEITPIQMMVDDERRIVGTQFHPEYYSDEHPEGRVLIENFLRWAAVV